MSVNALIDITKAIVTTPAKASPGNWFTMKNIQPEVKQSEENNNSRSKKAEAILNGSLGRVRASRCISGWSLVRPR